MKNAILIAATFLSLEMQHSSAHECSTKDLCRVDYAYNDEAGGPNDSGVYFAVYLNKNRRPVGDINALRSEAQAIKLAEEMDSRGLCIYLKN